LQHEGDQKVLILDGGVIDMDDTRVTANRMKFRFWEIPETSHQTGGQQRWRFEPARFTGEGQVTIQSPRLTGQCRVVTARWPRPAEASAAYRQTPSALYVTTRRPVLFRQQPVDGTGDSPGQIRSPGLAWQEPRDATNRAWQNPPGKTTSTWQTPSGGGPPGNPVPPAKMDGDNTSLGFTGSEVQLQMRGGERRSEVAEITVHGNVVVRQQQPDSSGDLRTMLELNGDRLQIISQAEERYRLYVSGLDNRSASVQLEELGLQGRQISLDQSANRLWIEGPGRMQMASLASPAGLATREAPSTAFPGARSSAGETTVTWQGGMVFDGQLIYFETVVESRSRQTGAQDGSVTAVSTRSAGLSITLNQRIRFTDRDTQQNAADIEARQMVMVGHMDAAEVAFPNHWQPAPEPLAWVSTARHDRRGGIQSSQEIFAPRITWQSDSGSIQCAGRGTVIARQLASAGNSATTAAPAQLASTGTRREGPIDFIKVDYDESFRGNTESRELLFRGNVHTFYTDTTDWTSTPAESRLQQPASQGLIMDCDQLVLAQWTPQSSGPTVEMIATGHARVQGSRFRATADRISYHQGNSQVVIEAPSRSNAEIWFNDPARSNQGHLIARTITYNIQTGEYKVQEMRQIDYSQQGPLRGR
jgi:hypothetical protein